MAISVTFSVQTNGLDATLRRLNQLQLTDARLAELHQRWGIQALNWVNENFRAEGALTGTPWQKLSPNTIAGRRKGSSAILQDTGTHLRSTFTMKSNAREAIVGTASEISIFHEEGTTGPYEIRPKDPNGVLAFPMAGGQRTRHNVSGVRSKKTYKKGGQVAFAKRVMHPGLVARPMLPRASMLTFMDRLTRTTNNFITELSK